MTLRLKALLAMIFGALLSLAAWAQQPPAEPLTADQIVARAIARVKVLEQQGLERQYGFTGRMRTEKLDKEGKIEKSEEKVSETIVIDGAPFQRTTLIDGKPLNEKQKKEEAKREKKFREKLAKERKSGKAKKEEDEDALVLNEELAARYHFTLLGEETINGRKAYKVSFLPRIGVKLPEKKRMDKVLNRLEGQVWFDAATYELARVDLHLMEPTSLVAGLGNVRELDVDIEMVHVAESNVFLPGTIKLAFKARVLFNNMHQRQTIEFKDYRRMLELVAER